MPGYAASKGGVAMLSRAIAWEYQKLGIRSNAIAPGGVATRMTSDVDIPEGVDFELIKKTAAPDYRMLQPEEPAALIAFLCLRRGRRHQRHRHPDRLRHHRVT